MNKFISLIALIVFPGIALAQPFPDTIQVPNGWQPEGIAMGKGHTFYVGSRGTGGIYRGDLRNGQGAILVPAQTGRAANGVKFDKRTDYIYVAGARTGKAYVYCARTGANVAEFTLTTANPRFINDVLVTDSAVYFTDSWQPQFYRLALLSNGQIPANPVIETIPLGGDYQFVPTPVTVPPTPPIFNLNGLEMPEHENFLLMVNSERGQLHRVDPATGIATAIDLGGGSIYTADGLFLKGQTLYVVQHDLITPAQQIAVIELNGQFTSGVITRVVVDSRFDFPSTLDRFGNSLYVVNARVSTTVHTPDTQYTIVKVPR